MNIPIRFTPIKNFQKIGQLINNDLHSIPNPDCNYEYSPMKGFYRILSCCKGFTYLMKLVMCVRRYENVHELITKEVHSNNGTLNSQNEYGLTALMIAIINSNRESSIDVVKLLISLGANLEIKSNNGHTALSYACMYSKEFSNFEIVTHLINNGADITVRNSCGNNLLMICAVKTREFCHEELIDYLIDSGIDVNDVNNHCETALHLCTKMLNGTTESTIRKLLQRGADPNIISGRGAVAFSYIPNYYQLHKDFFESGLDLNFQDLNGETFIMKMCKKSENIPLNMSPEIIKHFINYKINTIKQFISFGPDLNIVDKEGNTALMILCRDNDFYINDHEFLREILIKSKDTLNKVNLNGKSSFDIVKEKFNLTDEELKSFLSKLVPELNF